MTDIMDKQKDDINLAAALLAELYQLFGALDYEYETYKDRIEPAMDLIVACMDKLDQYFDDEAFDRGMDEVKKVLKR